jgi:hypothetical protein
MKINLISIFCLYSKPSDYLRLVVRYLYETSINRLVISNVMFTAWFLCVPTCNTC